MKKTLIVVLCLFTGCKELEQEKSEPVPCPLVAMLPEHSINIRNLPKGSNYELVVNNQIAWNSCSQTSTFSIISAQINPSGQTFSLSLQVYENIFQQNTPAEVKIYKTDVQCKIDPSTEISRTEIPTIYNRSIPQVPAECGDYTTSSFVLDVNYENSNDIPWECAGP